MDDPNRPTTRAMGFLQRRRDRSERVLVEVAGLPPIEAHVGRSVPAAAELRLAVPVARVLHRCPALVADRQAVLVSVERPPGRIDEERVHAVWTESQRRAFARVPAFRPVTLTGPGSLRAVTRDISAGGALLGGEAARSLRAGDQVALALELSEDDVLRARARVLRADPDEAVAAVALQDLDANEREHLARWVRARELDALVRLRRG